MIGTESIGGLFEGIRECRRIGVMGGTFDPVHLGHLYCAEQAKEALCLDAVIFIPAGRPAFKLDRQLAPFVDRLEMCRIAVSDNPAFFACDMESDENEVTYTADTMRRLRFELPKAVEIYFIAGTDAISSLHLWHDADELAQLCRFICVDRPDVCGDDAMPYAQEIYDVQRIFDIEKVYAPMLDISSSDIRDRLERGVSIRYLVPERVRGYIYSNNLYGADDAAQNGDGCLGL